MKTNLFALAHGRSGDKGNSVNVGIISRKDGWFDFIGKQLDGAVVAKHLKPMADGPVERFELPNLGAYNFLVHNALDGGGSLSLQLDAQGKTFAQALLRLPIELSGDLEKEVLEFWGGKLPDACVID